MAVKNSFQFANEILKDFIFVADNCERLFKMESEALKNHLSELWQNAFNTAELEPTIFRSLFDKVLDHLMTKGTITGETFLFNLYRTDRKPKKASCLLVILRIKTI
ncbi:MAG TPA: hypothetical protein PLZ08_10625 [Bacillota bacterium]|nr:hypothetical protein [Bacillota bacterium]HOL10732.1 hypothetical protein [Bacillota bacterium]HPO98392.1 hypothetical protein [Bacillota bacterium]